MSPRLTWPEAVELLAAQSGVVCLVGATDVGKSTLTLEAANTVVRAGRRPAVLDTDLGQGEIGPPGTIGVARLEAPVATVAELKPRALAFVGDTSVFGHLLTVLQATQRLVTHALDRDDDVVFVDTSGLVTGRLAEKLKLAKLTVLAPRLVVLLQKGNELDRLGALIAAATGAETVCVQTPPEVRGKSQAYRRLRRTAMMRRHLERARPVEFDAGQVRVFDAWPYTGTALPAAALRSATSLLKTEVVHGETTPDGVWLCVAGRPDRAGLTELTEEFRRKRVMLTPAVAFRHLLVGLVGRSGHLVDIGLLQGINFERAVFSVLTPARSLEDVRLLHFGRLRVRPDGSEIARLRPSDL